MKGEYTLRGCHGTIGIIRPANHIFSKSNLIMIFVKKRNDITRRYVETG